VEFLERSPRKRIIRAAYFGGEIEHFEMPAGSERVESLFEDGGNVFEADGEEAAVDVIEFLRVEPVVFGVVDFEAAVGGT
jgi:hypothetical protein